MHNVLTDVYDQLVKLVKGKYGLKKCIFQLNEKCLLLVTGPD